MRGGGGRTVTDAARAPRPPAGGGGSTDEASDARRSEETEWDGRSRCLPPPPGSPLCVEEEVEARGEPPQSG